MHDVKIPATDQGRRLERYLKENYPDAPYGLVQKLLRKGAVRINGKRIKANYLLNEDDILKIPTAMETVDQGSSSFKRNAPAVFRLQKEDKELVEKILLQETDEYFLINKPSGLSVQGGSQTKKHIDGLFRAVFPTENPLLVHRLDKDTSGLLVIAKGRHSAALLSEAFREKTAKKIYWAAVLNQPKQNEGSLDAPLLKEKINGQEKVYINFEDGKDAQTLYRKIAQTKLEADLRTEQASFVSWVELSPLTGRTHQLRVHCASALDCPILGDGKYGGKESFLSQSIKKLHLHAAKLNLSIPQANILIKQEAPLPSHMQESWEFWGWDKKKVPYDPSF